MQMLSLQILGTGFKGHTATTPHPQLCTRMHPSSAKVMHLQAKLHPQPHHAQCLCKQDVALRLSMLRVS